MSKPAANQVVIVPSEPGPLRRLDDVTNERDEIDSVLDEMFGEPDDEGPGVADAALLGGGAIAVAAAQVAALPAAVAVGGFAAIGLGAILPLRSLIRKVQHRGQQRNAEKLIGDGMLLDTQHPAVQRLVAGHRAVDSLLDAQPASVALRSRGVAHTLVAEVASLLDGSELTTTSEENYVGARADAIEQLADALAKPVDEHARESLVAARIEVESVAGTSGLSDASELTSDLLGERDL